MNKKRILFLDNMRAIAIVMVVGVHALGYSVGLSDSFQEYLKLVLLTISVPVFFFTDGYIIAGKIYSKQFRYVVFIKNSVFRLFVPWLLFTLIYTGSRFIVEWIGLETEKMVVGHSPLSILVNSYGAVYASHLYFLLSLFLARLLSPLISLLVNIDKYVSFLLCLAYVALFHYMKTGLVIDIPRGNEPILHAFWGLQFCLSGVLFYLFEKSFSRLLFGVTILLLTVLLTRIVNVDITGPEHIFFQSLYLFSFALYCFYFPFNTRILNILAANTIGIYLLHQPIVLRGVSVVVGIFLKWPLACYLVTWLVSIVVSYFLYKWLVRIPFADHLFGVKKSQ